MRACVRLGPAAILVAPQADARWRDALARGLAERPAPLGHRWPQREGASAGASQRDRDGVVDERGPARDALAATVRRGARRRLRLRPGPGLGLRHQTSLLRRSVRLR